MSGDQSRAARTEAVRALEAEFGELIGQFRRVITEHANRISPGMLPGAYKVFTTIVRRGPVTQSALAEHMLVDKGQLSRTVRELEQLGLVQRTPDPSDGRASLLSATPEGLERLEAARAPQENVLAASLETWSVDEIRSLAHLLHALSVGTPPSAPTAPADR